MNNDMIDRFIGEFTEAFCRDAYGQNYDNLSPKCPRLPMLHKADIALAVMRNTLTLADLAALVEEKSAGKWKVVPVEATDEMARATQRWNRPSHLVVAAAKASWRKQCAAAPKPGEE